MRAYRTEDYFSVPVDRALLRDYRQKAGFRRAQDFENALRHRGYAISYTSIEYSHGAKSGRSKIRGDSAKIIAEVLGTAPNNLFPGYDEAKALSKSTDPIPVQKLQSTWIYFLRCRLTLIYLNTTGRDVGISASGSLSLHCTKMATILTMAILSALPGI